MGVAISDTPPLAADCQQNESHLERDLVSKETSASAQTILKSALSAGVKYPKKFTGHLAREVKKLLGEGFSADEVTAAARRCVDKGLNPSNLSSLLVQARSDSSADPEANAPRCAHGVILDGRYPCLQCRLEQQEASG